MKGWISAAVIAGCAMLPATAPAAIETKTEVSFSDATHKVVVKAPTYYGAQVEVYTSHADLEPDHSPKWVVRTLNRDTVLHRGEHCRFGRVGNVTRRDLVKCPPGIGLQFQGSLKTDVLVPRGNSKLTGGGNTEPSDPRERFNAPVLSVGGEGNDILLGGPREDQIAGGHGRDRINGMGGDDALIGDAAGLIDDGSGNPVENPSPRFTDGTDGDVINGFTGSDSIFGEGGNDRLYGDDDSDRVISGGTGVDQLVGGRGQDLIVGWTVPISDRNAVAIGSPPPVLPGDPDEGERIYADERRLRNPDSGDSYVPPFSMEPDRIYCQRDGVQSVQFDDTDVLNHCLPVSLGDRYVLDKEPFGLDSVPTP